VSEARYDDLRDSDAPDVEFRDTGCDLYPHCLNCPLERCRHDSGGLWQIRKNARIEAVAEAVSRGATRAEVCQQFRISRRTFFRDCGGTG